MFCICRYVIKCHDLRLHAVVGADIDRVKRFIDSFLFEEHGDDPDYISTIHNVNVQGIRKSIKASTSLADVLKSKSGYSHNVLSGRKIVVIASPDHTHFEYCKTALSVGAIVLCEKPLAVEEKHVEELYNLALANKTYLHVGFQRRMDSNFRRFQEELAKPLNAEIREDDGRI